MWLGANSTAAIISGIDRIMTALNKNSTDGMIDNASALKTLLFLKQTAHIAQ